ncbi:MAG: insulinase family protein, partial [Chlamydiales bacterium]
MKVETPALSMRKTSKIRLSNGLEVFLVSDPDTPQSGAALAVNTGTWEDPKNRPGMAHFVEHMLFLGTEKYPEEEGFSRHLDEYGGKHNAFTMADRTVYMFSVNNDGFSEALDRFGQFFITPLFNPSGVERECNAIHQEFCKDIPLDFWRMHYVKKELANRSHPFHRFCIGNLDTLAKISQEELKKWYRAHYSAHRMHLVIYSPLDLSVLQKEVAHLFSQVKTHDYRSPEFNEPLFLDHKEKLTVIAPVQDLQLLELSWELPCFYGQDNETHADKLVSHVLGHEGTTSLLAQLKRENLADSLSVGTQRAGNDQCLFNLIIQLTSTGIQEYETVIQRCFEAIASIKQSGIPRFIFDEVKQMETMSYRFQSRQDVFSLVTDWAMQMVDEPIETFPQKTLIPTLYSPEKILALLDELSPEKCHYTLIASPSMTKIKPTQKEKWLGVDYEVVPIAPKKIALWSQTKPHKRISIPRPNPFLPEDFTLKQKERKKSLSLPKPTLISQTDSGKIYACSDDRFHVPEIHWTLMLKTPHISDGDPKSHALADLFCHAADESLNASAYEAAMAGLSYSLEPKHNGIALTIEGFNDKAANFLQTILQRLKTLPISQKQFESYQELLARTYLNKANENPIKQGKEVLWSILFKEYPGLNEKYKALQSLSYKEMITFCENLWEKSYIEALFYGNGSQEEAKELEKIIGKLFNTPPYL